ncbi:MAG: 30S ribosomal protein S4e [bacterium]|nr:30S ribosomal protein S4e [bacterium]
MKSHLKRLSVPKSWHIQKKGLTFVTRPLPGAHSLSAGMTLSVILKEMLKYAWTMKEVKQLLQTKTLLIDGKRTKEPKTIVGLMDTIELPETKEYYRMLINKKSRLCLISVKKEEAEIKPCKITGKSAIKKGKSQINTHDGRTVLADKNDYKVGDTLILKVPGQEISSHIKLEKGAVVFLVDGKYTGETCVVENIKGKDITLKLGTEVIETLKEFAFVIGKGKPVINVKIE